MEQFQSTIQQMLNEDKRRDTFKFLASLTGLKLKHEEVFVVGGSQEFSQRHTTNVNLDEQQTTNNGPSILDLPDEIYLHLFSFLSPIDLCQISGVCKKWYRLATDDSVWNRRLQRDVKTWPAISSRSNPLSYALVQSDRSTKEIYLSCSPTIRRRSNQIDDGFLYFSQVSKYFRSWFGNSKDLIMFGPGLESYTSPLVKNLLWDESKRFQTLGMIPGHAGFGSGIKMKLDNFLFNLITLYTNCMKERENRSKNERLVATQNRLIQSKDASQFEISPQVREVCREADGLIYVIDASQLNQLDEFLTDVQVMTREFSHLPLLILSCVRDRETKRWSAIDIVKELQLSSLGNPWTVQNCCVDDLTGVEDGFRWILTPKNDGNFFSSNHNDVESSVTH